MRQLCSRTMFNSVLRIVIEKSENSPASQVTTNHLHHKSAEVDHVNGKDLQRKRVKLKIWKKLLRISGTLLTWILEILPFYHSTILKIVWMDPEPRITNWFVEPIRFSRKDPNVLEVPGQVEIRNQLVCWTHPVLKEGSTVREVPGPFVRSVQ
jgi:hypothetical protein